MSASSFRQRSHAWFERRAMRAQASLWAWLPTIKGMCVGHMRSTELGEDVATQLIVMLCASPVFVAVGRDGWETKAKTWARLALPRAAVWVRGPSKELPAKALERSEEDGDDDDPAKHAHSADGRQPNVSARPKFGRVDGVTRESDRHAPATWAREEEELLATKHARRRPVRLRRKIDRDDLWDQVRALAARYRGRGGVDAMRAVARVLATKTCPRGLVLISDDTPEKIFKRVLTEWRAEEKSDRRRRIVPARRGLPTVQSLGGENV
jgi:hypothetical protein